MRWHVSVAILLAAARVATGQVNSGQEEVAVHAIVGVTVVDVERGIARPNHTVLLRAALIDSVGPTGDVDIPERSTTIRAEGLFAIPGLFDAHVHYIDPDTFGPLFVAHGVTAVREMGNDTTTILTLREELSAGRRLGPTIFAAGAIIDGKPPVWPFSEACDTPEEGRAAVRKLAAQGVDFIKVYSLLEKDVYEAILDEARALDLRVAGHVPRAVTIDVALAAGQQSVEHLDGIAAALAALAEVDRSDGFQLLPELPEERVTDFLRKLAEGKMYQCPTLVVLDRISRMDTGTLQEDPLLAYVPQSLRGFWESSRSRYEAASERCRTDLPHMHALVGKMHRAGVPLLCGTDVANPFLVAGFALHEEMRLLHDAGLPRAAVLRSATILPARFLGVESRLGSIAPGKVASLVLLRANPLEDIAATTTIDAVYLRGKRFDREALDGMLSEAKESASATVASEDDEDAGAALPEIPGARIAGGTYTAKFQQFPAGTETFLFTRSERGYHLAAHNRPQGGFQQPSIGVFAFDEDFDLLSAEWRQLGNPPLTAHYSVKDGKLHARATRGGEEIGEESHDLPDDAVFSGPFYAIDVVAVNALDLDVGEERVFPGVGFGFGLESWKPARTPVTMKRLADATLERPTGEVSVRHYTSTIKTTAGEFSGEIWTDEHGVPLRSVLTMPFGAIEVVLE